ncbi:hypothetical protein P7K49_005378 [Saguinus oedipus]|uniref:Uncharacterized protein n=1 Tax=Saguinus oedipus TaxID=9490 RepID=A0ABQ9WAX8_SAGOE|nr:hypothetical protein P7K49_005378 [Saguinus oedipus]
MSQGGVDTGPSIIQDWAEQQGATVLVGRAKAGVDPPGPPPPSASPLARAMSGTQPGPEAPGGAGWNPTNEPLVLGLKPTHFPRASGTCPTLPCPSHLLSLSLQELCHRPPPPGPDPEPLSVVLSGCQAGVSGQQLEELSHTNAGLDTTDL